MFKIKQALPMLLILAAMALSFSSCYETPDWVDENTAPGLGSYPVIASLAVSNGDSFKAGETVELDLRYWSDDPIREIVLTAVINEERTEAGSFNYEPNFAEDSQTDKLLMNYAIPPDLPAEVASITLEVEIINENTLTRSSSVSVAIAE
ncbi:hypothetical protein [Phaeodactylibacter luteus]|uniref:DUF1735 domain-containing protein n=1 Tax=Phaeodactylibacter luteus TaxID=1564516 RepID=A0A5C6RJX7_9BACT|nr:hypothetical protein [Phaeodactylibacter luteus]TXB62527.1 hypothetical protein FRY97_13600 [Phaeodactylibacter luteus]